MPPAVEGLVDGVLESDLRLQPVEKEVHESETARTRHQVCAEVRAGSEPFRQRPVYRAVLRLLHEPFVRGDEETARATRGVTHGEVLVSARVRLDAADDALDDEAWREILARAFLPFARRLLQQTLECRRLHVDVERGPLRLVDEADEPLEVHGVGESGLGINEDGSEQAPLLRQSTEHVDVMLGQIGP